MKISQSGGTSISNISEFVPCPGGVFGSGQAFFGNEFLMEREFIHAYRGVFMGGSLCAFWYLFLESEIKKGFVGILIFMYVRGGFALVTVAALRVISLETVSTGAWIPWSGVPDFSM